MTEKYKDWDVYDTLPEGWKIDHTTGSPLFGAVFITNGSPLKGGQRALLKIRRDDEQRTNN